MAINITEYDARTATVSISCWVAQRTEGESAEFLHRECPGPIVIVAYDRQFDCDCPHHEEEEEASDSGY